MRDVVYFSSIPWSFPAQRPQHLLRAFAAAGHRVFYLEATPESEAAHAEVIEVDTAVYRVLLDEPVEVWSGELGFDSANRVVAQVESIADECGIDDAFSMVATPTWDLAATLLRDKRRWPIVYDCMDEWSNFPEVAPKLTEVERRLVRWADVVVVVSEPLAEKWRSCNPRVVIARNAASSSFFEAEPTPPPVPLPRPPIIGYFGAIAAWFDIELLSNAAQSRPEYQFVLVGRVWDPAIGARLSTLPNVHLVGEHPFEAMPAFLKAFDVCTIPFRVDAITRAANPIKLYEYFAQGKPVVSTQMPEIAPHAPLLYVASPSNFSEQIDRAIQEPPDDPRRAQRIAVALSNRWPDRVRVIDAGVRRHTSEGLERVRWQVLADAFAGLGPVLLVGNTAVCDELLQLDPEMFTMEESRARAVLCLSGDKDYLAVAVSATGGISPLKVLLESEVGTDPIDAARSLRTAGLVALEIRRMYWGPGAGGGRQERLDAQTRQVLVTARHRTDPAAVDALEEQLVQASRAWVVLSERQIAYARARASEESRVRRIQELEARIRELEATLDR